MQTVFEVLGKKKVEAETPTVRSMLSQSPRPYIEGSNIFMKGLDALGAPVQALSGLANSLVTGENAWENVKQAVRENTGFSKPIESMGFGEGPQIMPDWVPLVGGAHLRGAIGLAGDVVLDPTNLVGGRIIKGIGGAIKLGAKAIGLTEAIAKVIPHQSPASKAARTLIADLEGRYTVLRSRLVRQGRETTQRLQGIADKYDLPLSEVQRRVTGAAETETNRLLDTMLETVTGDRIAARQTFADELNRIKDVERRTADIPSLAPPETVQPILDEARILGQQMTDVRNTELQHMLDTPDLQESWIDYVTHLITPEAKKLIVKHGDNEFRKEGLKFTARHAFQLQRKWRGLTVDQLNIMAQNKVLPGYEGLSFKLFTDDPAMIATTRLVRGARAMTDARVYLDAAEQFGKSLNNTLPDELSRLGTELGWKQLAIAGSRDKRVQSLAAKLQNYWFDPDVAKHMDAYYETLSIRPKTPSAPLISSILSGNAKEAGQTFLKHYDDLMTVWKKYTLVPFFAYHSRNFVGNIFNNYLGDVNPLAYETAARIQATRNMDAVFNVGGKQVTKRALEDTFENYGIKWQFSKYLDIDPVTQQPATVLGKMEKWATEPQQKLGNYLENNARIAHFVDKINKGFSERDAMMSVKKYLFDYTDLTPFEKAVMRRTMPFYAWTRNNLPLQVESILTKPGKYSRLNTILSTVQRDTPAPPDEPYLLQAYLKYLSPVRMRTNAEGNPEYNVLGGFIPAADLAKLTRPLDMIVEQLGPALKIPVELATNQSLFLDKPVEAYPGERERFAGVVMPKTVSNVLRNIRLLTEIDRTLAMIETESTRQGKPLELSTRRGEDVRTYLIRSLFGSKAYAIDLPGQRRYNMYQARAMMRTRRKDLKEGGINTPVIDKLLGEKYGVGPKSFQWNPNQ